ncbi:hypothetical protein DFH08DRAFT_806092 [Mycena albidolilacea]|uniref:Uncharacterized protein n=1 Tax=Mycena albidolilacea TaxID=1033008 RepID=A0AAD7A7K2_9AGAR|nr:hypothetical protein DFH08DRAFT_806092 [Mycena albidolilacea]
MELCSPSAEYLVSKLSNNPLGLSNMVPREELYGPNEDGIAAATPWVWNPCGLQPDHNQPDCLCQYQCNGLSPLYQQESLTTACELHLDIPAPQLIRLVHSHSSSFAGTSVGISGLVGWVSVCCVNNLIEQLTPSVPDFQLRDACDQLSGIMVDTLKMQLQLMLSHGMLAILEVLEGKCSQDLVNANLGFLESFCLIRQEQMQLFSPGLVPFPNVGSSRSCTAISEISCLWD